MPSGFVLSCGTASRVAGTGESGASSGGLVGAGSFAGRLDVEARDGGFPRDGRSGGEFLWKTMRRGGCERAYYYKSCTREVEWDLWPSGVRGAGEPVSALVRCGVAEPGARVAAVRELSESESPSPGPWPSWAEVAAFAAHRRAQARQLVTGGRGRSLEKRVRHARRRRNTSAPLRRPRPRCWHDIHWMPPWWHDNHWMPCGGAVVDVRLRASRRRPAESQAGRRVLG